MGLNGLHLIDTAPFVRTIESPLLHVNPVDWTCVTTVLLHDDTIPHFFIHVVYYIMQSHLIYLLI